MIKSPLRLKSRRTGNDCKTELLHQGLLYMDGSRCVWSLSHEVNRLTQISSAPSVSSAVSSNYHIKWKGSKKCANASVRSVFGSARQGVGFRRPCATLGVGLVAARPVPPTAALPQTPARMPESVRFSGALGKAWDSAAPALRWAADWSQRDQCHQPLQGHFPWRRLGRQAEIDCISTHEASMTQVLRNACCRAT